MSRLRTVPLFLIFLLWLLTESAGNSSGAKLLRGPYLQKLYKDSVSIHWRTDVPTDSRVSFGQSPNLTSTTVNKKLTQDHVVRIKGLQSYTRFYYSIGSTKEALAKGSDYFFFSAPDDGHPNPTRIWVIGDSGSANDSARAVRDAYYQRTKNRYTDVWLMLGDNAYENGTDEEYQKAVFDIYGKMLRTTGLWSTLGNHDAGQTIDPSPGIPYFKIFNFPKKGETGGVPSKTEAYYSFNYGFIHFISLDSTSSIRLKGAPMLTWLENDLKANRNPWVIAFWHHAPYSKGSHDSDQETAMRQMRENALPILEKYGVDLVLTGHSHSYQRSFQLLGHYGPASSFRKRMALDSGSGQVEGSGAYRKPAGRSEKGTVYAVVGSSGKVDDQVIQHPAMFTAVQSLGSLFLDVNQNRLDGFFVRDNKKTGDHFTIIKDNLKPTIFLTSNFAGKSFVAPAQILMEANASDKDGLVRKVQFFANGQLLHSDAGPPWAFTWNNVSSGTYRVTAKATDDLEFTTESASLNLTVQ